MKKSISWQGVGAGILVLIVAAICIRLGFWQLDRRAERLALNQEVTEALLAPLLTLEGDSLTAVATAPEAYRYRSVRVEGTLDEAGVALLRGRAYRGRPGVHVVAPLLVDGAPAPLLVDLGWIPAPDGTSADPRPYLPVGRISMEGRVQPIPSTSPVEARPLVIDVDGHEIPTFQRLSRPAFLERYATPLLPVFVERAASEADASTPPIGAAPPELDEGPHLGYAVQWFSFAAIAVIGFGIVVARSRKRS